MSVLLRLVVVGLLSLGFDHFVSAMQVPFFDPDGHHSGVPLNSGRTSTGLGALLFRLRCAQVPGLTQFDANRTETPIGCALASIRWNLAIAEGEFGSL